MTEIKMSFTYLVMKYKMLTGASLNEINNTNVFLFYDLLDAADAVTAEDSLRQIKIVDNKLLLNSKSGNYSDLIKHYKTVLAEKGIHSWSKGLDVGELNRLKAMVASMKKR